MNKWLSVQALRGIAVLGVVAFHSMIIEKKYSGGDLLLPDFVQLGQSGVDLFFVISGFVMVSVSTGRFARSGETWRFLWSRLTRIYPTYWFYFLLTAAVALIKPQWVNSTQGHQAELFSSFLLLPGNKLPLVMVAWSLIHELWFYIVFSVLLQLNERQLLPSLLFWGAIIVIVNVLVEVADLTAGIRIVLHPYTLEFIIGALVSIFISSEYAGKFTQRMSHMTIMVVLPVGLTLVYAFEILKDASLMRANVIGTLYGLLVLSLVSLEREKKAIAPGFLQFIGDMSYTVYLSHVLVLSAIGKLWTMANPPQDSLIDNMFVCLTMLAAAICYGWIGYRLIEKPILRISHRLRTRWYETDWQSSPHPAASSDTVR